MRIKSLLNIEIFGLNQEKIFNKLSEAGIEVFNLVRTSHSTAFFSITPNNLKKVQNILNENQIEIKKIKKQGFIKLYSTIFLRFGILIGFCLSVFLLIISNYFIINIKIYGNESLKTEDILNFLRNKNVNSLILKNSVNNDELEISILEQFNEISMVSIIKKGTTLIINIKEKILENILEFENIVSEYNGRIIDIKLVSGTPKKKVGDIIKIGDILVEGYFLNSHNEKVKINPQAEIRAEIWFEEKIIHYDKSIVSEYTGNEIKLRTVSIWGLELFSNFTEKKFDKFEIESSYIKLNNVILPFIIKSSIIKEIKIYEKFCLFEDVKDNLINECKEKALQKIENDDIIKNEKCTLTIGAGFTVVSYLMIVEKNL